MCIWIKPYSAAGTFLSACYYAGAGNYGTYLNLSINGSSHLEMYAQSPPGKGGAVGPVDTFGVFTINAWNHVSVTLKNGVGTAYMNGSLAPYQNFNFASGSFTSNTFVLCGDGQYSYFPTSGGSSCEVQDLRVYNTALTATQIQGIYQSQGIPPRASLP
jgi:hypothetical protein